MLFNYSKNNKGASDKKVYKSVTGPSTSNIATTCASVLPLTPDNHGKFYILKCPSVLKIWKNSVFFFSSKLY